MLGLWHTPSFTAPLGGGGLGVKNSGRHKRPHYWRFLCNLCRIGRFWIWAILDLGDFGFGRFWIWEILPPYRRRMSRRGTSSAYVGMGRGKGTVTPLLKGKVQIPPPAGHFIDPPPCLKKKNYLPPLSHKKIFPMLQVEIMKNVPQSAFFGLFCNFTVPFLPHGAKSVSPSLEEKSESPPPCWPIFYPPPAAHHRAQGYLLLGRHTGRLFGLNSRRTLLKHIKHLIHPPMFFIDLVSAAFSSSRPARP